MAGPTGFVERVKGKVMADTVYVGKGGVHEYEWPTVDVSVASTTIPNSGLSILKASSGPQTIKLDPPQPGIEKTIQVTTVSSGAIAIASSTDGTITFDGRNSYWHPSTVALTNVSIALVGQSTSMWVNLGINPVYSTGSTTIPHGLTTSS